MERVEKHKFSKSNTRSTRSQAVGATFALLLVAGRAAATEKPLWPALAPGLSWTYDQQTDHKSRGTLILAVEGRGTVSVAGAERQVWLFRREHLQPTRQQVEEPGGLPGRRRYRMVDGVSASSVPVALELGEREWTVFTKDGALWSERIRVKAGAELEFARLWYGGLIGGDEAGPLRMTGRGAVKAGGRTYFAARVGWRQSGRPLGPSTVALDLWVARGVGLVRVESKGDPGVAAVMVYDQSLELQNFSGP